ncbi:MAG: hypothetical protein Q7V31_03675 [Parvibaculum sp.]|nr:hypothetical protein [Parvibaculum sp.]MDO8838002.1 hypothetical protein [Parvibaculum sp.]
MRHWDFGDYVFASLGVLITVFAACSTAVLVAATYAYLVHGELPGCVAS